MTMRHGKVLRLVQAASVTAVLVAMAATANAGLVLNEILITKSPLATDRGYYEFSGGTPLSSYPLRTYVVVVDGTQGAKGKVLAAISVPSSGGQFSAEGTYMVRNGGEYASVTAPGVANASIGIIASHTSITCLLVQRTSSSGFLNFGVLLDPNEDGLLDLIDTSISPNPVWASVYDSVGWTYSENDFCYSAADLSAYAMANQIDAISRFNGPGGNTNPNDASAWWSGQINPSSSLAYDPAHASSNFASNTSGGVPTPGRLNVPSPASALLFGVGGLVAARRRR
jgi:hypothetical protein